MKCLKKVCKLGIKCSIKCGRGLVQSKKEQVDEAIKKFIEEKSEHSKLRSYYFMYDGKKFSSKYIREMAYSIATGEAF